MKGKEFNLWQSLVTLTAVVTAVSQTMPDLQAVLPPKYAVGVLAVTNVLSSLLPKIIKLVDTTTTTATTTTTTTTEAGKE